MADEDYIQVLCTTRVHRKHRQACGVARRTATARLALPLSSKRQKEALVCVVTSLDAPAAPRTVRVRGDDAGCVAVIAHAG